MAPTIGARIKELRGKLLSQRELAEQAGVSVDLIRKLEQGRRHTLRVGNLQRIARALDVTVAELFGRPASMPAAETGVTDLRRALTPVDDLVDELDVIDQEPLDLVDVERTVDYLWGAYWAGRYELLTELAPPALAQLRATYRAVPAAKRARAAHALARGYQAAGDTLVHLHQPDAAWLAVREAMQAANNGDDELLFAAMRMSVVWQLLIQGRYAESERVALRAAADIEPGGQASYSQVSAYGTLTATAATAAARACDAGRAGELLDVADTMAQRLGYDRADHQTTFGPAKVAMMAVDVSVVQDDFVAALNGAKRLPRDAALPLAARARHLADVALAQLRLGRDRQALQTIMTVEQMAPDWIKHQSLPRQVVAELVERERRISPRLRELARRLGAWPA